MSENEYPYFKIDEYLHEVVYVSIVIEDHPQGNYHMATFDTLQQATEYVETVRTAIINYERHKP